MIRYVRHLEETARSFSLKWLCMGMIIGLSLITACTLPTPRPTDPKTPEEQLLISQALEKSMKASTAEILQGTKIALEFSGLNTEKIPDGSQRHVKNAVSAWLGSQGCVLVENEGEADLRVRVMVESIGTRETIKFFGIPSMQSLLLPVVTPELTIYKRERRQGYARFHLDIFQNGTGRYVRSTPSYKGSVKESRFTLLFFINWVSSDVDEPLESL